MVKRGSGAPGEGLERVGAGEEKGGACAVVGVNAGRSHGRKARLDEVVQRAIPLWR